MLRGFSRRRAFRVLATFGLSAAGGLIAHALGFPAAWISGGLLVVAIASLAGFNSDVPRAMSPPVYLVLGVYAGSGVSQETLAQIGTWPTSFAILGIALLGVVAGSYWWLHDRCGWARTDALLASMPGALSLIMATAEGMKADVKKVALAQSLRLLILVEIIPIIALMVGPPIGPDRPDQAAAGPLDLLILFGAGTAVAAIMERLRVPGGWFLGGLIAAAFLHLTGIVEAALPAFLVVPGTIALGAIAGSRFRPGDLAVLPHIAGPALVAFAIASSVSAAGAGMVTLIFGVNIVQTLLAFAPGAVETLIVLGSQMDVDPAYVAAHHTVRLLVLVAAVPLIGRWLARHP